MAASGVPDAAGIPFHRSIPMGTALKLAIAFGAGAAAMYFLEPMINRRRREMARDRSLADSLEASQFGAEHARHVAARARGAAAEAKARTWTEPVDDERIHARIMSKLGHLVDQPGDVRVEVLDGCAMLSGRVRTDELPGLIASISAIPGVADVQSRLTVGRGVREATPGHGARH
jgi:osmotically-inducible protein OsmY